VGVGAVLGGADGGTDGSGVKATVATGVGVAGAVVIRAEALGEPDAMAPSRFDPSPPDSRATATAANAAMSRPARAS
jgi:hypothetical protein